MMTFDQLIVFHKIAELGSFKAAAEALHKTQPAISFAIKKLEEELGVELFDRSAYRPELTVHGRSLLERSVRLLQGMQELADLSQSFKNEEEPEISIALDGISLLPDILKLLKVFSDRFPHTKLNLGFDLLAEAEKRVLRKEAQLAVTHFVNDKEALEILPLTSVRMLPVMSRELFLEKKVSAEADLMDIEQIVVGNKEGPQGISFGLLEGGKKWRIIDSNIKREIIFAGLGWGHLPEHTITRELDDKKLMILDFASIKPRELEIRLIRLKKYSFGPVARELWKELKSLM
jgi:DNA-binding transcriptional LysR family regulator